KAVTDSLRVLREAAEDSVRRSRFGLPPRPAPLEPGAGLGPAHPSGGAFTAGKTEGEASPSPESQPPSPPIRARPPRALPSPALVAPSNPSNAGGIQGVQAHPGG